MKINELVIISMLGVMITALLFPLALEAQAPEAIAYQAIVRDVNGNPVANQLVSIQVTLHQGSDAGAEVYCETHSITTNPFGLVNLRIGTGTIISGSFPDIDWGSGPYFLELDLDPEGGTAYVPIGTTQLVSVPYALFSEQSGQLFTAGAGIDITDGIITNIAPNAGHTGDATGSELLTVVQLQGRPLSPAAPNIDQVLQWDGSQWSPTSMPNIIQGWSLIGNSGTDPGVNFLGTTDNQSLRFRVNNQLAGEINAVNDNTFLGKRSGESSNGFSNVGIGSEALFSNTTGSLNTASGCKALYSNAEGHSNIANGANALYSNTSGCWNTANGVDALYRSTTGSYNTANGGGALMYNTTGYNNTANGYLALYSNSTGIDNTATGSYALYSDTTGYYNTATGSCALYSNSSGYDNTASGVNALRYNTTGHGNTANGTQALFYNTTGSLNVAIGIKALYNNTDRSMLVAVGDSALFNNGQGASYYIQAIANTAIGSKSLYSNTTGSANTANGYQTLYSNTTGSYNTAEGYEALYSNTGGCNNTAIGTYALHANSTGHLNTANGYEALVCNTTGSRNTANGSFALFVNNLGSWNTASGSGALYYNTTGNFNTANGCAALYNTSSDFNTAIGYYALFGNMTGTNNTALGQSAAYGNQSGSYNTCIGSGADVSGAALNNATALGSNAIANASNQVRLGDDEITSFYCLGAYTGNVGATFSDVFADNTGKIGYVASSARYKENIEDMESVNWLFALRPVNFTYTTDQEQNMQYGLIAEEVEKVKPDFVRYDKEGRPETVSYSSLISPLLKAVQEQQAMIAELQKRVAVLEEELATRK